jgi:hypothetical protein
MVESIQLNIQELKNRDKALSSTISSFGSVLSAASAGDLTTKIDLSKISEGYRSIGEDINSMIEATKERGEELNQAINNFGEILSKAASGDLTAKVELFQIGEEYKPIGENINTTVESMKLLINEAESTGSNVTAAVQEMATNLKELSGSAQQIAGAITQIAQGSSTHQIWSSKCRSSVMISES